MKKQAVVPLLMAALMVLAGCHGNNQGQSDSSAAGTSSIANTTEISSVAESGENTSEMFTDRDIEIGYDEETSAKIVLSGDSVSCDSDAVQISDGTVTITEEGTYILSGTLNDGMVVVNAEDTAKIQLVLNGAHITSSTSAAVYVLSADKVFITTASGSSNTLSNGGEYVAIDDNNIDAAIFSKSDLTLNGAGTLAVNAAAGHGIVSKDDLVLTSGTYQITAASHGLSGKDSVRIANGTYTIVSGKDGIHAENTDDASLGFLYIADGTFHITADGDGMSAGTYLQAEDGDYTIEAGGGSANAATQSGDPGGFGFGFGPGDMAQETTTDDSASTKGMKATTDLIVSGGTFTIDSADDALHSNGNVTISGGAFEIASGDDGIHGDSAVTISDGKIDITQSYEGIEGLSIDIIGGNIALVASDDGLNSAGGNDSSGFGGRGGDIFTATEGAYIKISGGNLHVNASGDGIDSNGDLTVTGGETYVSGPTDSGNGTLDYSGEAVISGGIFVAAGSAGMAQNFGSSSTQGVIMVTVNSGSAGSTITLSDSSGGQLISWQADKEYSSVIVSCPEIIQGSTYTLSADGNTTQVTMDSLVYGSGEGMGGMMGGGMGRDNIGGMPGGQPGGQP